MEFTVGGKRLVAQNAKSRNPLIRAYKGAGRNLRRYGASCELCLFSELSLSLRHF